MDTISTTWQISTYDVWGNEDDGYSVNDIASRRTKVLEIPVTLYNVGTPMEFEGAFPSDKQIEQIFGVKIDQITINGDDLHIYLEMEDGYPLGEMICEDYASLSPIRK